MILKKTFSTLIACGAVGAATMIPTHSQAISVFTSVYEIYPHKLNIIPFKYAQPIYNIPTANGYGEASWYGPGFYGNRTANGERYNGGSMTAAHRYLPFGTRVRVTNRNNGRSVVVRVNDRGPYVGGRIIDLSAAAADVIGVSKTGVAPVKLEVLN